MNAFYKGKILNAEVRHMGESSTSNLVDIVKFNVYLNKFVALVVEKQGEQDGKISFEGKFLQEEEGYKKELYNKYQFGIKNAQALKSVSEKEIVQKFVKFLDDPGNNLLNWRNKDDLKTKLIGSTKKRISEDPESINLICRIYKDSSENDEQLFNEAMKLWGKKFPVLSVIFFLKDMNNYPPVRPYYFERYLKFLGADVSCIKNGCSWGNYQSFIDILKNVQDLLNESGRFSENVELIDAHSFVWMIHYFIEGTDPSPIPSEDMTGRNILYYGVPGSGKSYKINEIIDDDDPKRERTERVVFHPEYTYSDFVGQILPRVIKKEGKKTNDISYDFIPGPFTRIMTAANDDPDQMYYLVIEEINRGNAPAIFGDIFQLLDRKYGKNDKGEEEHGESEYGITNADIAKAVYGDKYKNQKVKIPANLTIYATMNTSDQNVFTLDTAFQRRWEMDLVPNDFTVDNHDKDVIGGSSITWGDFATAVNNKILSSNDALLSSEDKRLGVFFVTKDEVEDKYRFSRKVLKYLWDDAFRLNREAVFQKGLNSLEEVIKRFDEAAGDPLEAVFNPVIYGEMKGQKKDQSDETVTEVKEEGE